ncbi:MAG: hypothetical protein Q9207_008474 [Kuettlingeria erythrocarpa]
MDMYLRISSAHLWQSAYAPMVRRMITNLKPHLMVILQMLETYRSSVADIVQDHDASTHEDHTNSNRRAQSCFKELEILRGYNELDVFTTEKVFELLKTTVCRQLRPVSYAGSLERRVRGWNKPPASQGQVMSLMVFGGLNAITKIIAHQSYNMRIGALEQWMRDVLSPTAQPEGEELGNLSTSLCLFPPLDVTTKDRMRAILPDLAHFFNIAELEKKTGSEVIRSNRMDTLEFYGRLCSDDFGLQLAQAECFLGEVWPAHTPSHWYRPSDRVVQSTSHPEVAASVTLFERE